MSNLALPERRTVTSGRRDLAPGAARDDYVTEEADADRGGRALNRLRRNDIRRARRGITRGMGVNEGEPGSALKKDGSQHILGIDERPIRRPHGQTLDVDHSVPDVRDDDEDFLSDAAPDVRSSHRRDVRWAPDDRSRRRLIGPCPATEFEGRNHGRCLRGPQRSGAGDLDGGPLRQRMDAAGPDQEVVGDRDRRASRRPRTQHQRNELGVVERPGAKPSEALSRTGRGGQIGDPM